MAGQNHAGAGRAQGGNQRFDQQKRAFPDWGRDGVGGPCEGCRAVSWEMGIFQFRGWRDSEAASEGNGLLLLPRTTRRGGYHLRTVLPDAAGNREEKEHAQRRVRERRSWKVA